MGKHELAKRKYEEVRKELDIEIIKNAIENINLKEVATNVENYFGLIAHKKW